VICTFRWVSQEVPFFYRQEFVHFTMISWYYYLLRKFRLSSPRRLV
jgi:hypothetical protein